MKIKPRLIHRTGLYDHVEQESLDVGVTEKILMGKTFVSPIKGENIEKNKARVNMRKREKSPSPLL